MIYNVDDIIVGEIIWFDIQVLFGELWCMGVEDGKCIWIYGKYCWFVFGEVEIIDLVVCFNEDGIVLFYVFNIIE